MNTTEIIWNGCDGHAVASTLSQPDYDIYYGEFDGHYRLYTQNSQSTSIPCVEVPHDTIEIDSLEDGMILTQCGRVWIRK